ncbi:hypothetical protein Tco_1170026, partial [Tanacetum coccineum]
GFFDIGNLFYTHSPCTPFAATAINNKEEQSYLLVMNSLKQKRELLCYIVHPDNEYAVSIALNYNSSSIACNNKQQPGSGKEARNRCSTVHAQPTWQPQLDEQPAITPNRTNAIPRPVDAEHCSSNKSEISTATASDKLEGLLPKVSSEANKITTPALSASDPILMPSQDSRPSVGTISREVGTRRTPVVEQSQETPAEITTAYSSYWNLYTEMLTMTAGLEVGSSFVQGNVLL